MKTLIDTTSLLPLCVEFSKSIWNRHGGFTPAVEPLLFSDEILVDKPSAHSNREKFQELDLILDISSFVNENEEDEAFRYNQCTKVIVPMIAGDGASFKDLLRRHIHPLDHLDMSNSSNHKLRYYPSTYWANLSGKLSREENDLVQELEKQFGDDTPFSGAALTNIVRLFYYSITQEVYRSNLFLSPSRSELL